MGAVFPWRVVTFFGTGCQVCVDKWSGRLRALSRPKPARDAAPGQPSSAIPVTPPAEPPPRPWRRQSITLGFLAVTLDESWVWTPWSEAACTPIHEVLAAIFDRPAANTRK